MNEQLRELTIKDCLTSLPNRAFFLEALGLKLRQRQTSHTGLLFCDLDRFKQVNDRFGHHVGDELLQVTAQRMKACAREGDLVARLSGDEFVVLCNEIDDGDVLDAIAQRLTAAVARRVTIAGIEITPQVSVGGVLAEPDENPAALLRRADTAMYRVKSAGGDRATAGRRTDAMSQLLSTG